MTWASLPDYADPPARAVNQCWRCDLLWRHSVPSSDHCTRSPTWWSCWKGKRRCGLIHVEQLLCQLTACGPVDCSALVPPPTLPPRAQWVSASPARVAWPCPNVCCVRRVSRCLLWCAPRPCQRQRRRPASRRDLQPMWVAAAVHMWHALLWHVVSDWRSC